MFTSFSLPLICQLSLLPTIQSANMEQLLIVLDQRSMLMNSAGGRDQSLIIFGWVS